MYRLQQIFVLLLLYCLLLCITGVEITVRKQLPFCKDSESAKPARSLIFVSTLDGKLSALDASQQGQKIWSLDFKEKPLLSSNIHRRDLNNNGQWVRLVPSLNGGLYKFDGESLESVPVSVEQLLQSSFRYSDDLIFSGGKETKTYGIVSLTGKILYECKMNSCANSTEDNLVQEDVLIVKRHQHIVRASEPRSGLERWNFSVGQHDLIIIPHANMDCSQKTSPVRLEIEIRAIIPEGLIVAFSEKNPSIKLWEYKFNSPIVSVWREDQVLENEITPLNEVNLFESPPMDTDIDLEFSVNPGLYIGMHERQLYIQENPVFRKAVDLTPNTKLIKYPWRPYPAIEIAHDVQDSSENIRTEMSEIHSTTAMSVLYNSEYINGNGFYLFSKEQMQLDSGNQCNGTGPRGVKENASETLSNDETLEAATPIQVIYVSIWYYWFEILIISITTAVVVHCLLSQKYLHSDVKDAIAPPLIVERHIVDTKNETRLSQSEDNDSNFKSRYMTDYEPLDCLGRGGYGVVFEARNKLDDCNYAIKRIALPKSQYSRDRVMREVKALAKLDHHNIVRYFSAWMECPPAGWQEEHDRRWLNHEKFPNSNFTSESSAVDSSVRIEVPPSNPSSIDSACEALELNKNNDDSFIVFDAQTDEKGTIDDESDNEDNTESYNTKSVHLTILDSNEYDKSSSTDNSIVFENTGHTNIQSSEASHSIVFDQSKHVEAIGTKASHSTVFNGSKFSDLTERKSQLNLDLRKCKYSKSDTKMFLYIQMQLCQRVSLREWLKSQNSQRNILKVLNIFEQIVNAVEYVHLQGLIHRDLKPSNIFFAFDNKIKIGDFGLVTAMTEGINGAQTPCNTNEINIVKGVHTARVGTHLYMSPEQMNGKNYNYKVDIYSLGIILFELLIPFSTEMERVIALTNLRNSTFPDNFSQQYPAEYKLLKMMLDNSPEKRPTTLGIKAHPPFLKKESIDECETSKWHFDLPQLSRHSSGTNSSATDSWEINS